MFRWSYDSAHLETPRPVSGAAADDWSYLMSGITATARGRFVCAQFKSWEAFQGSDGQVAAGAKLDAYVLTGTDETPELIKIWTGSEDISRAQHAYSGCKFGDPVEIVVAPGARGSYRFVDRVIVQAAKSA